MQIESLQNDRVTPVRTCVGCNRRGGSANAAAMIRLAIRPGRVEIDVNRRAGGRGAYVHARPGCLEQAPQGLARRTKGISVRSSDLAEAIAAACAERIDVTLGAARRARLVALGPARVRETMRATEAARADLTAVVAVDAPEAAAMPEIRTAIAEGRVIAWGTQASLKSLLGDDAEGVCVVRHRSLGKRLVDLRAAVDASAAAMTKVRQHGRRPEAR